VQKIIGVTELQRRFKAVFDEVVKERRPYVLLRGSRPEAALIPYDDFLKLEALVEAEQRRAAVRAEFDDWRARQAELSQELGGAEAEIEAEIEATVEAVRAQRWARQRG
jgi:prevent-host-death family protein